MDIDNNNDLFLHLDLQMIFNNDPVDVYINDIMIGSYEFVVGDNIIPIQKELYQNQKIKIRFKFKNLKSQKDMKMSNDNRKLGIGVSSFFITENN